MRGSEEYHTKFLKDVLGCAVPPCHKIVLDEIVKKDNFSWQNVLYKLKNLLFNV